MGPKKVHPGGANVSQVLGPHGQPLPQALSLPALVEFKLQTHLGLGLGKEYGGAHI